MNVTFSVAIQYWSERAGVFSINYLETLSHWLQGILIFEPCFTFISLLMIFYTASLTPASLNHLLIFSEVKTQPEIATNQAPVTTHHLLEPNVTVD